VLQVFDKMFKLSFSASSYSKIFMKQTILMLQCAQGVQPVNLQFIQHMTFNKWLHDEEFVRPSKLWCLVLDYCSSIWNKQGPFCRRLVWALAKTGPPNFIIFSNKGKHTKKEKEISAPLSYEARTPQYDTDTSTSLM
jgi:hypothetical protein